MTDPLCLGSTDDTLQILVEFGLHPREQRSRALRHTFSGTRQGDRALVSTREKHFYGSY